MSLAVAALVGLLCVELRFATEIVTVLAAIPAAGVVLLRSFREP